jgi:hypothetical protein
MAKKTSSKKAPVKAAPKKANAKPAPIKAAPKKAAPKKAAPKQAAPEKAAPKKAAPTPTKPAKATPVKVAVPTKGAAERALSASEVKKARLASRLAEDAASKIRREPRAYIEGNTTTDAFAEELGEDALRAITSGQDEEADIDLVSGNRGEGLHVVE